MQLLNPHNLICQNIWLLLFFSSTPLWALFRENDIKLNNYYLGSSRAYSIEPNFKVRNREIPVFSRSEYFFDLQLHNDGKTFTVYIKKRKSDVLANETTFLKIFNVTEIGYDSIPIDFKNSGHLYEGYILDIPYNSSVSGYVKDNNFYGHLIVNDTIYCIDEFRDLKDLRNIIDNADGTISTRNSFIFKRDSVTMGMFLTETKSAKLLFKHLLKVNYYKSKFQSWKSNGRLCPMIVVIDHSFFKLVHNSNLEATIFQVLFSLEEANAIFRSTDFDQDGIPDNIGFYVKKMVVMTTNQPSYFLPDYSAEILSVNDYLVKFMRFEELKDHCLGIAFTAQKFDQGTLGASYTPDSTSLFPIAGICDRLTPSFGTMNGLVITASTFRTPLVNQIVFEITITHELGHSFGSQHDETTNCLGYIMSPKSYPDYAKIRTHTVFSQCSKEHILRTLVIKGDCLEPVQTSFCGNGIVEDGEDCDCGLTRDCLQKDPCCIPRRTKERPCKINIKKGFECHPSQGECCTKTCRYNERLSTLMTCSNIQRTCPCAGNKTSCACGLNGICIENECHNAECGRLRLKQCQCQTKTADYTCQVCCQLQNECMPAVDATNKLLSSAQKTDLLEVLLQRSDDEKMSYEPKQLVSKKFCQSDRCVSLSFSHVKFGDFCLYKGKLGKCQLESQCQVSRSKQIFPAFESASSEIFRVVVVHILCYLIINLFLI